MSGVDRRDFLKLMAGAIAATYIPKPVMESVERISEPMRDVYKRVGEIVNAEWFREETRFSWMFRMVCELPNKEKYYMAVMVDDYALENEHIGKTTATEMVRGFRKQVKDKYNVDDVVFGKPFIDAMASKNIYI